MTHDDKRNGTTTLFAALDVATGKVFGQCLPQHRHEEFLVFLRTIDANVPKGLAVHLILDNYATHKHADVAKWLAKHKRFHLHVTPTSSSWLSLVERWFRELTDKNIRCGSFPSVPDLIASIEDYLRVNNDYPKPLVWTATADVASHSTEQSAIHETHHWLTGRHPAAPDNAPSARPCGTGARRRSPSRARRGPPARWQRPRRSHERFRLDLAGAVVEVDHNLTIARASRSPSAAPSPSTGSSSPTQPPGAPLHPSRYRCHEGGWIQLDGPRYQQPPPAHRNRAQVSEDPKS
jgi:transposase